jgi:hypothetical protein
LCAGWNLLVEIGMTLEINLDKPEWARKVGNEFFGVQGPDVHSASNTLSRTNRPPMCGVPGSSGRRKT